MTSPSTDEPSEFNTNNDLPLFISDSMPDTFGTQVFSKYLEQQGKNINDLSPVDKLTYIGSKGMGVLEYYPSKKDKKDKRLLDLKELSELSAGLLNDEPGANLNNLADLFHIGASPGGAQPKVLINIDFKTGNIYKGDSLAAKDQESWILKFNRERGDMFDGQQGKLEYAYYLMARQAGIKIMESRLEARDGAHYFMTKRFDRAPGGKLHTQTLHAFARMNYQRPNTYSYEQVFTVLNQMRMTYGDREQLFRIMVFNIIGRNVDDHTKNFSFVMDASGKWTLAPAYDLMFTYNENYNRPTPHFLSVNGKNQGHRLPDILRVAKKYSIKRPKHIINEINGAFLNWETIATDLNISTEVRHYISEKLLRVPYKILGPN